MTRVQLVGVLFASCPDPLQPELKQLEWYSVPEPSFVSEPAGTFKTLGVSPTQVSWSILDVWPWEWDRNPAQPHCLGLRAPQPSSAVRAARPTAACQQTFRITLTPHKSGEPQELQRPGSQAKTEEVEPSLSLPSPSSKPVSSIHTSEFQGCCLLGLLQVRASHVHREFWFPLKYPAALGPCSWVVRGLLQPVPTPPCEAVFSPYFCNTAFSRGRS